MIIGTNVIQENIPGNSSTADALKTPVTIQITGVDCLGVSFNGSTNIELEITGIPVSLLTGSIDADKLKNSVDISIAGVTCETVSFDGSTNIELEITEIPVSLIVGELLADGLKVPVTIQITGVTSAEVEFSGLSDVELEITEVPTSLLTGTISTTMLDGVISVDNLPLASESIAGVIKLGDNLSIDEDGYVTALPSGSDITVTQRSGLGDLTNLDDVLEYIANVFSGIQQITKIVASSFDTPV